MQEACLQVQRHKLNGTKSKLLLGVVDMNLNELVTSNKMSREMGRAKGFIKSKKERKGQQTA